MPKVAFCTLGCKVNQYDSQAMLERLRDDGYESVAFSDLADVYVVNTCTVTGTGDKKSRQMIRRARKQNPEAAIVVTGCLAQREADKLLLPGVRLVLGTQRRGEIAELLRRALAAEKPLIAVEKLAGKVPFEKLTVRGSDGHTRATLKIQEGCRNFCAYCIIPSVRGPLRSRPLDEIRAEAARLGEAGYREIVVTGIHLTSYGLDLDEHATLADALECIHCAPGVERIRIGSLEPTVVTDEFIARLRAMPKICPHFMLALQSGSDTVLQRMGRRYDTAQYMQAVEKIRSVWPDAAFQTDVMTGFPGETDAEFEETKAFLARVGYARIHVFPYSEREGTRAVTMPGSVPKALREARAAELIALGREMERAYIARFVGRTEQVLFEQPCEGGAEGYTREYVRVVAEGAPGALENVTLFENCGDFARGKIFREENPASIR